MPLCLLVAILFLLCFLKQPETTRAKNFSELADPHHENSSRGSSSGGHHCRACDAYRAHKFLPEEQLRRLGPLREGRWLIGARSPTRWHWHIQHPQINAELAPVLVPVIQHDVAKKL